MDVPDEAARLPPDRGQESVDLSGVTLGNQLDAAVGQVPDVADDVEAACQPSAGGPESDTLDLPREVHTAPFLSHAVSLIRSRHAVREIAAAPGRQRIPI